MIIGCKSIICIDLKGFYNTKTHRKPRIKPTLGSPNRKMSTLTHPKDTFHSICFNETLDISYWGIDEWIWVLRLDI